MWKKKEPTQRRIIGFKSAKTTSEFAADAVAIDGKRSIMFGMESRDIPNGMGVIEAENEWSVALAITKGKKEHEW